MLLNFRGGVGRTLKETLNKVMEDKMLAAVSGKSLKFEVCTSHDLAPVISSIFEIQKDYREEKSFVKFLKTFNKNWKKSGKI